MLVLTRKVGERIVIGNDISVVVTKVSGNRVTLGVSAPATTRVIRQELIVGEAGKDRPGTDEPAAA